MNTSTIVLISVLVFGAVLVLTCGGAIGFVLSQSEVDTENPEATVSLTQEIVDIDIPDDFEPCCNQQINAIVARSATTHFQHAEGEGSLLISTFDSGFVSDEALEEQHRQDMENDGFDEDLQLTSSEYREFEISGETRRVKFAQAEHLETGESFRLVSAYFRSPQFGPASLVLEVEEQFYDEEAVVRMLESI